MPRGKKFDAAEKHFQKKELKFKETESLLCAEVVKSRVLEREIIKLKQEISNLNNTVSDLSKYLDLSKEDLDILLNSKKSTEKLTSLFGAYASVLGKF